MPLTGATCADPDGKTLGKPCAYDFASKTSSCTGAGLTCDQTTGLCKGGGRHNDPCLSKDDCTAFPGLNCDLSGGTGSGKCDCTPDSAVFSQCEDQKVCVGSSSVPPPPQPSGTKCGDYDWPQGDAFKSFNPTNFSKTCAEYKGDCKAYVDKNPNSPFKDYSQASRPPEANIAAVPNDGSAVQFKEVASWVKGNTDDNLATQYPTNGFCTFTPPSKQKR